MRSKICKAKRKDNKEWVEGYYFCMVHDDKRHEHHFIIPIGADLSKGTPIEQIQVEIDIDTLCDDTGLTDKNGRKIWENDIVSFVHSKITQELLADTLGFPDFGRVEHKRNYAIEFVNTYNSYGLRFRNKSVHFPCKRSTIVMHDVEVIGNIFDNPELLEKAR